MLNSDKLAKARAALEQPCILTAPTYSQQLDALVEHLLVLTHSSDLHAQIKALTGYEDAFGTVGFVLEKVDHALSLLEDASKDITSLQNLTEGQREALAHGYLHREVPCIEPERRKYCLLPAKEFCDCDWCCYLRARQEGLCPEVPEGCSDHDNCGLDIAL
jgi:hypothetical protein